MDSEQLGLLADDSIPGIDANGSDFRSGGLAPGFSSGYGRDTVPNPAVPAFHFALFSFDQPVDIPGVTIDDVSNFDRNIWMATGTTAPDFSGGFLSGLAAFDVVNSADDSGDGLYTHGLGAAAVSYLLVGAPPENDLGPLVAGGSQFYIDSFGASATVPVPPAVWLFGSGLLGMVGVARRKKRIWIFVGRRRRALADTRVLRRAVGTTGLLSRLQKYVLGARDCARHH